MSPAASTKAVARALPATSFREFAFELRVLINREVAGNQQVEEYLARYPSASLALAYRDFVRATGRLAELYGLLDSLIPLEREVRALHAASQPAPIEEHHVV